jgi:hypothetical protein
MNYQVIRSAFGREVYRFRSVYSTREEAIQSRRQIVDMSGGTIRISDLKVIECKKDR